MKDQNHFVVILAEPELCHQIQNALIVINYNIAFSIRYITDTLLWI